VHDAARDGFVCDAARAWRAKYTGDDLLVLVTDVSFRSTPGQFAVGEGVVVAPIAADLPGVQELLDVRGYPAPARVLKVGGVTALGWEYAGTLHRDIRYVGLALVRRKPGQRISPPDSPSFATLPDPWRIDAVLTASELEDEQHNLDECKAFGPWVKATAGAPPYTDQIVRFARRAREGFRVRAKNDREDVCAAIRANQFTAHEAQVVTVMAAREVGAPAVGLTSTEPNRLYQVATYADGPGWISLDVSHVDDGFKIGAPPLLTIAPLAAPFRASEHGFWYASGTAFSMEGFGRYMPLSQTRWVTEPSDSEDVTFPSALPLAELCP
jgi:hypothetical protein